MQTRSLIAAFATVLVAGCFDLTSPPTVITDPVEKVGAVLTVTFPSHPADTLKVLVTDSATIEAANTFVRTGAGPHMLTGTIVRGPGLDTRYPFHYLAPTVRLADVGMEICDGAPMRTASDVNDFFGWATGSANSDHATWCPWSSKPIAVERYIIGDSR